MKHTIWICSKSSMIYAIQHAMVGKVLLQTKWQKRWTLKFFSESMFESFWDIMLNTKRFYVDCIMDLYTMWC
jgi:hypothetical protein